MKSILLFVSLACMIGGSQSSFSQTLAIVGKEKVTVEEYQARMAEIVSKGLEAPDAQLFLEELIRQKVGLQEAKKKKLANDAIFKARYEQELYKFYLEKTLIKKIEKIKVTEAEMKSFYRKNPEMRIRHILIEVGDKAKLKNRKAGLKRATEIYKEIQKSKRPFGELAKLYSDDTFTNKKGGDLGYHGRGTLPDSIYNAALKLKSRKTSQPISSPYGFHIIQKTSSNSYDRSDKVRLRAVVFSEKRKALFDRHFRKVKKTYRINIDKKQLEKLKR